MVLTDTAIKHAKPLSKPYRLPDGSGLYLLVQPSGKRWWRQDYRFDGKDKTLSLGVYPEVSLKMARDRRDEISRQVVEGINPSEYRKQSRQALTEIQENSFENVAREWFLKLKPTWAPTHSEKIIRRLERDIFPWLG
ncbi:Prophage integrase IntS [Saezia sanguinis]|uniref:Prophage integrase IntS n=1 Tax=Saezia sanguinis TaxID=1965230 RepID=A0A433SH70_9BURK|nr:Prophage integrase IntS [Saezia sanguinis]